MRQFVVCGRHSNPVPAENSDILISSQSPLPPFPYLKHFPTFCLNHHHIQDFLLYVSFYISWIFCPTHRRISIPAATDLCALLLTRFPCSCSSDELKNLTRKRRKKPVKVHLGIVNLSNKRNFWRKSNLKVLAGGGAGDRQPDRRLECVLVVVGTSRLLSNHSRLKFFEYYPLAASTERNTIELP